MGCGSSTQQAVAADQQATNTSSQSKSTPKKTTDTSLHHQNPQSTVPHQETQAKVSHQEPKSATAHQEPQTTVPQSSVPQSNDTGAKASVHNASSKPTSDSGKSGSQDDQPKKGLTEEEKEKQRKDLDELKKQADSLLQHLQSLQQTMEAKMGIYYGDFSTQIQPRTKIVRIFTSSTFTDTSYERNTLMQRAYPQLKAYCRSLGYEFQVVDMRWGVRDEATDDHMGSELCFRELRQCQKLSTGPYFVSLLSHKYGYSPNPRIIVETDFDKILAAVQDQKTKDLFNKWYTKDTNHVPSSYKLSPISTHIPNYLSSDKALRKEARGVWWEESSAMMDALNLVGPQALGEETARRYTMSITEAEVELGLLEKPEHQGHCIWLRRIITDIEQQEPSYPVSRYIECLGSEEKWQTSRELLKELRDKKMEKALKPDSILNYQIQWCSDKGVDPDQSPDHKMYLQKMCDDFVEKMKTMIGSAIKTRKAGAGKLMEEIGQHITFCRSKCQSFRGREETLKRIQEYVTGDQLKILVLHGSSGSGKTSLLAKAAMMVKEWMGNKKTLVVLRFLGTTSDSSSITPLLQSVIEQVYTSLGKKAPTLESYRACRLEFLRLLLVYKLQTPLVILLDSLDQLNPSNDARHLAWLPALCTNKNIKIIVSTLPETIYECFPALKAKLKDESQYIEVPILPEKDVITILDTWLSQKQRRLTPEQKELVLSTFNNNPTPLFLKLCFDEASRWTSFAPASETVLHDTVRQSIDALFQRLEKMHGKALVSKALGYLTLAQNGVTESELEDILSCDDEILNDVYAYWTPPVRRLPPLLLVRLKYDLEEYLVERGADGVTILAWYHRQFIEAAMARYCGQEEDNRTLHAALADFFFGTWADGKKKPFTGKDGILAEEDRQLPAQPLKHGDLFNLRKINNLPYHRILAKQLQLLKDECLCNYEFVFAKMQAVGLGAVIDDYDLAVTTFPEDELVSLVFESLTLSQGALAYDCHQLTPQLLGRLERNKITQDFLDSCLKYQRPYLAPNRTILTKPGGQMKHCIAAHQNEIDMMDLSTDGSLALTVCGVDKNIKVWDVSRGKVKREYSGLEHCETAFFCMDNEYVAMHFTESLSVRSVETGRQIYRSKCPKKSVICVAGPENTALLLFSGRQALLFPLSIVPEDIKPAGPFSHTELIKIGPLSKATGCSGLVAVTDDDAYFITAFDLEKNEFSPKFRAYDREQDEDGDWEDFDVDALSFLPDQRTIVYVSMFNAQVRFADVTTGSILKTIQGNRDWSLKKIGYTGDGKQLYITDRENVKLLDVEAEKFHEELLHPVDLLDVRSVDLKTVVTIAEDSNLRIWDRTRPSKPVTQSDTVISLRSISMLYTCPNPRYILGTGSAQEGSSSTVFIYDVVADKIISQAELAEEVGRMVALYLEENLIFCVSENVVRAVNIKTMQIHSRFQCQVADRNIVVLKQTNNIVTSSRGRMHVLISDIATGKIVKVWKTGIQQRIEDLAVNDTETVLVCRTDEGPLVIFDLKTGKLMKLIHSKDLNISDTFIGYLWGLSPDGKHFLFSVDAELPGMEGKSKHSVTHLIVWAIQEDREVCRLYDLEYVRKYQKENPDDVMTGADQLVIVNNEITLVSEDDFVIRVHNYVKGTILHRLTGHTSSIELSFVQDGPYFLSVGSSSEENSIRLWSKETFQCVATYTLDGNVRKVSFSQDGRYVFGATLKPVDIVIWRLYHGDAYMQTDLSTYPVTYTTGASGLRIDVPEDEITDFGTDLDDDEKEQSDEDEDEDEDEEGEEKEAEEEKD